jgi:hypothetical protein
MSSYGSTAFPRQRRGAPRCGGGGARLAAALTTICLLGAACGLPYDSSPRAISGGVPQGLTNSPATVPPITQPSPGNGVPAELFYVQIGAQSSKLVQFLQRVPVLSIAEVLSTLQSGPTLHQAATQGGGIVTNDLPVGSNLRNLGVVKGVAHISADSAFYDQQSVQAELEFGQIVYSLTQTKALGVTSVQFYFGGSATSVVNASGQFVTGTVDQSDYCGELQAGCPRQPTTTTTTTSPKKKA